MYQLDGPVFLTVWFRAIIAVDTLSDAAESANRDQCRCQVFQLQVPIRLASTFALTPVAHPQLPAIQPPGIEHVVNQSPLLLSYLLFVHLPNPSRRVRSCQCRTPPCPEPPPAMSMKSSRRCSAFHRASVIASMASWPPVSHGLTPRKSSTCKPGTTSSRTVG